MEREIKKVIVLCQGSSNPISYWAHMSEYEDRAENLTSCCLMEWGWNMSRGMGGPEGKQDKQLMWRGKQTWTLACLFLVFIFFIPRLAMIKVSDVDKCLHSQFISSCLAGGCLRQRPRLITPEARGMMLGGGGVQKMMQLLGFGQWITLI